MDGENINISISILNKKYPFTVDKDAEFFFRSAAADLNKILTDLTKDGNASWNDGKKYDDFDYLVLTAIYLLANTAKEKENYKKENIDILENIYKNNKILENIIVNSKENAL